MEVFDGAIEVRLRNFHNKYLVAKDDERHVGQDRNDYLLRARWTVEVIANIDNEPRLRFRSCYGYYLAASFTKWTSLFLPGRNVFQEIHFPPSVRVEWQPVRQGSRVLLRSFFRDYLRANAGIPPWRNSVTADTLSRRKHNWFLWNVEIVERQGQLHPPPPFPFLRCDEADSMATDSSSSSFMEGSRSITIQYNVADDVGNADENIGCHSLSFAGRTSISTMERLMQEETGLDDIYLCVRDPLDDGLVPLSLPLPSDYTEMQLVVVKADSKVGRNLRGNLVEEEKKEPSGYSAIAIPQGPHAT